jgi:hypothetical protein
VRRLPASWTSVVAPSVFETMAAGRSHFRTSDLLQLVASIGDYDKAGSSFADLQRDIQISLGWSDEYQHRFCIRHHYLGASRPGGRLFFGDPEVMTLAQFAFRLRKRSPMSTISSTLGTLIFVSGASMHWIRSATIPAVSPAPAARRSRTAVGPRFSWIARYRKRQRRERSGLRNVGISRSY